MKNFSLKTKRNSPLSSGDRPIYKILVLTIVAVCAVFVLRGAIGAMFYGLSTKVQSVSTYFQTSGATLPTYIRDRQELKKEIERLKEELAAQSGDRSTISRLSHENEELRALMDGDQEPRVLASVIARPPFVPYDLVVLDRGSDHGIKEGALVYHKGNHVIGAISKVYPENSLVTLFSSAGAETTVYLYGPNVFAYAYGEGGGVIRISVPQGIDLHEGDPVVLPSIHTGDLGVIERIVSLPSEPEQNAYVTFPVSLQSLRTVAVGKSVNDLETFEELLPNVTLIHDRYRIDVPDEARSGTSTTTPTSTPQNTATTTQ